MWVNKETMQKMKDQIEDQRRAIEQIEKRPYLMDVNRVGRKNVFLFVRDGELVEVETMSTIADDIKGWKDKLIR